MINSDSLSRLRTILEEIMLNTRDAEFKNAAQPSAKMLHVLDELVRMQSLIVSIRAGLIEKVFSIHPDLPGEITDKVKSGADNIILFNRRKVDADRRKLHTYLADDRRLGLANRRHSA